MHTVIIVKGQFGIVINQLGGKTYSDHLTSSARLKKNATT